MAGGRIAHSPPPLWHITPTHLAHLLPDATLDLYSLPSTSRLPSPELAPHCGTPTALTLISSKDSVRTLIGTQDGNVVLDSHVVATIPGGVGAVAVANGRCYAAGGVRHEVVVMNTKGKELRRHTLGEHRVPISAMAVESGGKRALVCGQSVSLVDLGNGEVVTRFSGHGGVVSCAVSLGDGRFVTGGREGGVYVWDGEGGGGVKRRKKMAVGPSCVLGGVDGGVQSLGVGVGGVLVAVFKDGAVGVWTELKGVGEVPCTFVVKGGGGKVFGAVVVEEGVMVLFGNALKPKIWEVKFADVEEDEIFLPEGEVEILVGKKKKDEVGVKQQLVKGATRLEGSAVPAMPVKDKRKGNGYMIEGMEDENEESEEEDDEEGDAIEPSIQQKLLELGVTHGASEGKNSAVGLEGTGQKAVLGSRANVLLQAVQSQDAELFDRTIEKLRTKVLVRRTIERIPGEVAAGALLDTLIERLRQFPMKAELLALWIREVLLEHTGALISQRKNKSLTALIALVTERTQGLEGLSRLEGRLELVVSNAERLKRGGQKMTSTNAIPQAEYEEEDVSEGEEDNENSESDSVERVPGRDGESDDAEEDETGDFSESGESSDEDSDEEMEDMPGRHGANFEKGENDRSHASKMNGKRVDDGDSSDSSESADDGG